MKTTSQQRMAALRERERAKGREYHEIWIDPADWEKVREYIRKINKARDGAKVG